MAEEVTEAEAIADIQRVAAELGEPPSVAQYREHGRYSVPTAARHFDDSFVTAREAADVAEGELRPNTREELLADIRRVADHVGGEPSKDEYKDHGDYALSGITYRFESWVEAKKEAGVYDVKNHKISKGMLIEDMQRVDEGVSGPLSQRVYDEHGEWTSMTAKERFPSWETACQEAGVTRPDMGPRTEESQELLEDIRQVSEELGRVPGREKYNEVGEFSRQMAINRFGSWPEAVRRAGFEPYEPGGNPGEANPYWKGGYEPYYGRNWHEKRRQARRRDNFECADCGMAEEEHLSEFGWGLEVHHIKPIREYEEPEHANGLENLVTLCRTHHREYESLPESAAKKLIG